MRVLLISILKGSHRNLSCLALFSFLSAKGVPTELLFIPKEDEYRSDELKKLLLAHSFDVVGISVLTDGFRFAQRLSNHIRRFLPNATIVFGGIHATLCPEESLQSADYVCVGEGEHVLWELVKGLGSGADVTTVPGLGMRTRDGDAAVNPPWPLVQDLDSLPFNRYDWEHFHLIDKLGLRSFDRTEYTRYSSHHGGDYTIVSTRSCPFSCTYCCNAFLNRMYGNNGKTRKRSVGHVIAELKNAKDYLGDLDFINFIDDQFLTSKSWNREFCARYKEEIGIPFIVRLVPGTFKDEDVKVLKDAGMSHVNAGIQSGSARTNRTIFKRRFNKEMILEASRICMANGVHPIWDFIIQNELEDHEDRRASLELMLLLDKPYSCNFTALTPFPRTDILRAYDERGIQPRLDPYETDYFEFDQSDPVFQLAKCIPHVSTEKARYYLDHLEDPRVREELRLRFETVVATRGEVIQRSRTDGST
jgi:anaerobic magnesium-protoporphyrin IX monomethyl ester cyclase